MSDQILERAGKFLNKHLWWLDPYYRKYGGPNVTVNKAREIGDYDSETLRNLPAKRYFFEETPYLWDGKRVLDIGCGGDHTLETLTQVYPNVDYVGLDIEVDEGVDVVADATKKLPFDASEFDTICAFGFLPEGFLGKFAGNIRHWRKPLKSDGYFVSECMQSFWHEKPGCYATIRKAFRIVEEKSYAYTFKRSDSNFAMPIEATFMIAQQK